DLAGSENHAILASSIVVKPVGFVHVRQQAGDDRYGPEFNYLGWWPDPLLDNFGFDVAKSTSQPVWIEVRVPRDLPAGSYVGTVTVRPKNSAERSVGLTVEVADVTLPKDWRFENLLSFHEGWGTKLYKDRWTPELREKFIEFLLDRRFNVISMYGNEPYETAENLIRFAERGQNLLMVAWLHPEAHIKASNGAGLRQRLDAFLPPITQAGYRSRCIVYGWDERGPEWFDEIRYCAELLRDDFPDIPLASAGTDPTYGTGSTLAGLPNIIYCPTMAQFDPVASAKAVANGNRTWWYEVWWVIDHPLIRSRLIPWQTYKAGVDGFLFWCINRWTGNDKPATSAAHPAIRLDWDPALDGQYPNSTAMYLYPGDDGPVSSLRLENFRDGMEDFDLLAIARELLARIEKGGEAPEAAAALRDAITLDDPFLTDASRYSKDPALLQERRRRLIRAVETAGCTAPAPVR
ncbi:MAG: glycoside hydrolase domain-containing protein, partial [Planctomycetota bacterium]